MQLRLNISPKIVKDESRAAVMTRISSGFCAQYSKYGNYLAPFHMTGDYVIRVYSLEKRRKKVSRKVVRNKTVSTVISKAHWVGIYYDIPISVIKFMNVKLVQLTRHFVFVPR